MNKDIKIYDAVCHGFQNEYYPNGGFSIEWYSNIGFGNMDIIFDENGVAHLMTECMCSDDDKQFAYDLIKRMIDEAVVEE